ncbi:MAG: bacillithiol biosynthesis cysteine-adding enzyme BshC [Chitinophagaceae bacterium]|nr:bacillithiol biosynthesis cysteine-adding enzyme BshC [Chitinophagaceae bacterium]
MDTNCQYIPYQQTGFFSKMVIDYLQQDEKIHPFYKHPVSIYGIKAAIEARKATQNHRQILVEVLRKQYAGFALTTSQERNLNNLLLENTFTITTAHQPNIFTGHLYFIYKILHTVKLALDLSATMPENYFVPVFYMGSEDADLDELGHVFVDGEKLTWDTKQTGAVGRMKVDKGLLALIDRMAGRLEALPHGKEIIELFKAAYIIGSTIQQATLHVVNSLFNNVGLLVLIPDNADLKRPFNHVIKRELRERFSHPLVEATAEKMREHYKVQASGRELNLFYLIDDNRERIEFVNSHFEVKSLHLQWTEKDILNEADLYPERFSANVILRGMFQEMILPNIAFIGGGGEVAYWLELKKVFEACEVPYPVIILRNSFLLATQSQINKIEKLGFTIEDFFKSERTLLDTLVKRESKQQLTIENEKQVIIDAYNQIKNFTNKVDATLNDHVASLAVKVEKSLSELEKKMIKAEKKKFNAQALQIHRLKTQLFPENRLQERNANIAEYYSLYGKDLLVGLLEYSLAFEAKLGVVTLPGNPRNID